MNPVMLAKIQQVYSMYIVSFNETTKTLVFTPKETK